MLRQPSTLAPSAHPRGAFFIVSKRSFLYDEKNVPWHILALRRGCFGNHLPLRRVRILAERFLSYRNEVSYTMKNTVHGSPANCKSRITLESITHMFDFGKSRCDFCATLPHPSGSHYVPCCGAETIECTLCEHSIVMNKRCMFPNRCYILPIARAASHNKSRCNG